MYIKPLVVNKKAPYTFNKPSTIPPEAKNVSPFFVHIACSARGFGKTHSILMLVQELARSGFYNRFIIASPTSKSDIKQSAVYEEIAEKYKYLVEAYPTVNEDILDEIQSNTKEYTKLWNEYFQKKKLFDKLKKRGVKSLTDEELTFLFNHLLEDGDLENLNEETIFADYPEWLRKDQPPTTHFFIDDCYAEGVMSKTRNNPLTKLVVNGRHQHTSLTIATQSLSSIPRAIRSNTSLWSVWNTKAKQDLDILLAEVENAFPSREHFYDCMEACKMVDYGFLYIDAASLKEPIVKIGYNDRINFDDIM